MMGIVRGLITLSLLLAFLGLCIWAWSARRRPLFDQMARLALDEDCRDGEPDPASNGRGARSRELS